MKRFRTITAICLTAIAIMVAGNIWYLYSLYNLIKKQTLQTVSECVRKADILEIISRLNRASQGDDDSFIKLTLMVQGEKTQTGEYDYPNLLNNLNQTMSQYFHVIEQSDPSMPERNIPMLDSIFNKELNNSGLYPEKVTIYPIESNAEKCDGLWSIDFAMTDSQPPIYKVCFSPLNGHILRQMSGIIVTSAAILVLMGFLIWYLLHRVGWKRRVRLTPSGTRDLTPRAK